MRALQEVTPLLSLPAGTFARTTEILHAEDSLERAAAVLRESGSEWAIVSSGGRFAGVVTEQAIGRVLAEGSDLKLPVAPYLVDAPTIAASATAAEALRKLVELQIGRIIVVSSDGAPVGWLTSSDLTTKPPTTPVPPVVGGMATPFGVYLTSGVVNGGAGPLALVATGAMMGLMFTGADILSSYIYPLLPQTGLIAQMAIGLPFVIFLLTMRLLPIAGTHAAEHQVVHALERGERLVPEIVKRMPRVHPRCGTNLAVGLSLFIGLFNWEWVPDQSVRTLVAMLVAVSAFRPIGGLVQYLITTKPANAKQIESGIRAAEDLLRNYAAVRRTHTSVWMRIFNGGILHVMAGATAVILLLSGVATLLNLDVPWTL